MAAGRERGGQGAAMGVGGPQRLGYKWNGTMFEEEGFAKLKRARKVSLLVMYISGIIIGTVLIWASNERGLLSPLYYVVCPSLFFVVPTILLFLLWRFVRDSVQSVSTNFWMDDATYDEWILKQGLVGALVGAFNAKGIPFTRTSKDNKAASFGFPLGVRFWFDVHAAESAPKAIFKHSCKFEISSIKGNDGAAIARDVLSALESLPVLGPHDRPAKDSLPDHDDLAADLMIADLYR